MDGAQFTTLRSRINASTIATVLRIWSTLDSWRDRDAARLARLVVPVVQAGQVTVGQATSAYMASQAGQAFNATVAPPAVPAAVVIGGRGVPGGEVYRRPFVQIYTALDAGKSLLDAVGIGRSRLAEIADLDLQRAYSLAAQHAMNNLPERYRPRLWRRVTTGGHSCALCVVASTHRYHRSDLHPIHRKCDCRVEPDFSGDAGQMLDDNVLERVHAAVADLTGTSDRGGRAPDYRQLIVEMTAEHGELGPLLVRPSDHFTGPSDLA